MPNALPVRRWQLRQWYAALRTGSVRPRLCAPARSARESAPRGNGSHPLGLVGLVPCVSLSGPALPGDAEQAVAGPVVAQHVSVAADAQPLELLVEHLVEFRAAVAAPLAQQLGLDLEAERALSHHGVALVLRLATRRAGLR